MNTASPGPLTPDALAVLRVISRMDLSLGIAVGQSFGRTVTAELIALREQGYIREHVGRRHDGTPTQLYTITTKGSEALQEQDQKLEPIAARATGPSPALRREPYSGGEMRPFTGRAGAMDALKYPSRVGNRLHYRDGGIEPADKD
jgi:hypothetical protein